MQFQIYITESHRWPVSHQFSLFIPSGNRKYQVLYELWGNKMRTLACNGLIFNLIFFSIICIFHVLNYLKECIRHPYNKTNKIKHLYFYNLYIRSFYLAHINITKIFHKFSTVVEQTMDRGMCTMCTVLWWVLTKS